jgi:hypothetical protein
MASIATKQATPRLPEPLLDENPDRYCMFPLKYQVRALAY